MVAVWIYYYTPHVHNACGVGFTLGPSRFYATLPATVCMCVTSCACSQELRACSWISAEGITQHPHGDTCLVRCGGLPWCTSCTIYCDTRMHDCSPCCCAVMLSYPYQTTVVSTCFDICFACCAVSAGRLRCRSCHQYHQCGRGQGC